MMVRYLPQDELYHHGVKGQRWGIRRRQDNVSNPRRSANNQSNAERKKKKLKRAAILIGASLAIVGGITLAAYMGTKQNAIVRQNFSKTKRNWLKYDGMTRAESMQFKKNYLPVKGKKSMVMRTSKTGKKPLVVGSSKVGYTLNKEPKTLTMMTNKRRRLM